MEVWATKISIRPRTTRCYRPTVTRNHSSLAMMRTIPMKWSKTPRRVGRLQTTSTRMRCSLTLGVKGSQDSKSLKDSKEKSQHSSSKTSQCASLKTNQSPMKKYTNTLPARGPAETRSEANTYWRTMALIIRSTNQSISSSMITSMILRLFCPKEATKQIKLTIVERVHSFLPIAFAKLSSENKCLIHGKTRFLVR